MTILTLISIYKLKRYSSWITFSAVQGYFASLAFFIGALIALSTPYYGWLLSLVFLALGGFIFRVTLRLTKLAKQYKTIKEENFEENSITGLLEFGKFVRVMTICLILVFFVSLILLIALWPSISTALTNGSFYSSESSLFSE
jgi:uncharacterized membrane protein